jgi:hypothetical protein
MRRARSQDLPGMLISVPWEYVDGRVISGVYLSHARRRGINVRAESGWAGDDDRVE